MVDQHLLDINKIGTLSNDGMLVINLQEKTLEYCNEAFLNLLEIKDTPMQAEMLWDYINEDDIKFVRHKMTDLKRKGVISNVQFQISVGGTFKHLLCDAYLLEEDSKVFAFIKDVTKSKEHENYIITYGGKKDTLLEMLSHNLSGPLNLAKRVTEMLEKSYRKQKPEDLTGHISFIKEATKHCIDTIHDFLKEEHLVSEKIFTKKNRFDVVQLINVLLAQFNHSYPCRNLVLQTDIDDVLITSDDVKLMQIVNNLLSNALKFTPANCAIDIKLEEVDNRILLIVADDGIGIPDHLKPLVFQKYTPAGRKGLNGEKSIGVGLSIVKKLVELLRGEIHFESSENKGTTFFVYLPKE